MVYRVGCRHARYQQVEGHRPVGLLAELLRIRVEKNIGQEILGEKIGVPRSCISRWECGRSLPRMFLLQAWANAHGYELALTAKALS